MKAYQLFAISLLIQFHLFYFIARLKRDFSVVDISWALGFLNALGVAFYVTETWTWPKLIVFMLVLIWGVRLGSHILTRNLSSGKEDWRYTKLRQEWGTRANLQAYFKVFLLQSFILYIVALPLVNLFFLQLEAEGNLSFALVGAAIALAGLIFESVGDHQLKKHIKGKREGFCRTGLWAYSRHPNYFGEALFWWGIGVACLQSLSDSYHLVGPLMLTLFLLYVSGVPMLEEKYDQKYKNDPRWWDYKRKTHVLLPIRFNSR